MEPTGALAMPPAITPFGALHTVISLLPAAIGVYAFVQNGKIDPATRAGKLYLVTMLLGSVTGLMIFHHGGFGPGHVLSILTILLVLTGVGARRVGWFGASAPYVETISLSLSFFLLCFFLTTEGLTRLPPEHPYAPSQEAVELLPVRLVLLVGLLVGVGYQIVKQRKAAAS
jgi:uncharacterized membrane protein